MAYKRYIKRGGKIYGPYIYHSKKINGKVVSEYRGKDKSSVKIKKKEKNSPKKYFFIGILGLLIILFAIILMNNNLTGNATLSVENSYSSGDTLKGNLKLVLEQNEVIPASTDVIINLSNTIYKYKLKDLVSEDISQGDFYIKGKTISGTGGSYRLSSKDYPTLSFILDIYSEKKQINKTKEFVDKIIKENKTKIIITNESVINKTIIKENTAKVKESKTIQENTTEKSAISENVNKSETTKEASKETKSIEKQSETKDKKEASKETKSIEKIVEKTPEPQTSLTGDIVKGILKTTSNIFMGLTGKVILENEINGKVSFDKPFIYLLKENQTAEIKKGSIKINSKKLSDNSVQLNLKNNQINITTNYANEKEILVDLGKLNIPSKQGDLTITLIYNNTEIISASKKINVKTQESAVNETLSQNITITNNTLTNLTLVNETITNITIANKTGINTTTIQFGAVLNKPVKWKKKISLNNPDNVTIEIPKESVNISVFKITKNLRQEIENKTNSESNIVVNKIISKKNTTKVIQENNTIKQKVSKDKIKITGQISAEIDLNEKSSLVDFFKNLFGRLTGNVISVTNKTTAKEVAISDNATEYEIEYETPGPVSFEKNTSYGKEIIISSEVSYKNILAYTELPKESKKSAIKLYHYENGSKVLTKIQTYDLNNNSLIDYIEWVVPHLSNQTYELIIEITKAEHLDSNKTFISDIYDSVKSLDGNWSETINNGDYVRVTFEKNLTSDRDITIYARATKNCSSVNNSVLINNVKVPCNVYQNKKRIDEIQKILFSLVNSLFAQGGLNER